MSPQVPEAHQSPKPNNPQAISERFRLKTEVMDFHWRAFSASMATGPSLAGAPLKHEVQVGRCSDGACMPACMDACIHEWPAGWMDG